VSQPCPMSQPCPTSRFDAMLSPCNMRVIDWDMGVTGRVPGDLARRLLERGLAGASGDEITELACAGKPTIYGPDLLHECMASLADSAQASKRGLRHRSVDDRRRRRGRERSRHPACRGRRLGRSRPQQNRGIAHEAIAAGAVRKAAARKAGSGCDNTGDRQHRCKETLHDYVPCPFALLIAPHLIDRRTDGFTSVASLCAVLRLSHQLPLARQKLPHRAGSSRGQTCRHVQPIAVIEGKAEAVPFLVEGSAQDRARRGNIAKAFAFESALKAVSSAR
jgi:hypothetical protein